MFIRLYAHEQLANSITICTGKCSSFFFSQSGICISYAKAFVHLHSVLLFISSLPYDSFIEIWTIINGYSPSKRDCSNVIKWNFTGLDRSLCCWKFHHRLCQLLVTVYFYQDSVPQDTKAHDGCQSRSRWSHFWSPRNIVSYLPDIQTNNYFHLCVKCVVHVSESSMPFYSGCDCSGTNACSRLAFTSQSYEWSCPQNCSRGNLDTVRHRGCIGIAQYGCIWRIC